MNTTETPFEFPGPPGSDAEGADASSNVAPGAAESEALRAERDDLFGRLQRVSADYQNAMRRAQEELPRRIDVAVGDAIRQLVPVLDLFERAMAIAAGAGESGGDAGAFEQGMKLVHQELMKTIRALGVEIIEAQRGEMFDPHRHEAMMRQSVEGLEPGRVTMQLTRGYCYKGRTLRAAQVAVSA